MSIVDFHLLIPPCLFTDAGCTVADISSRKLKHKIHLFVCFVTSQVNSFGNGGTVSSPNHNFFLGKLEQAVNQYFLHILSLVADNNPP